VINTLSSGPNCLLIFKLVYKQRKSLGHSIGLGEKIFLRGLKLH
jgi:hypothetical protein